MKNEQMTNEKAITILEDLASSCNYEIEINSEDVEALNKAIEALKMKEVAEKIVFLAKEMEADDDT